MPVTRNPSGARLADGLRIAVDTFSDGRVHSLLIAGADGVVRQDCRVEP
ncbi:MAG: hypothetical protein ACI9DC_004749 [Gammaproteobacteria bacterium]|jgi:hypothetical protein